MSLFGLYLISIWSRFGLSDPESLEEPILRSDRLEVAVRSGVHEFGSRTNQDHSTSTSAQGRLHTVPNVANPARSSGTPSATRPLPRREGRPARPMSDASSSPTSARAATPLPRS